MKNKLKKTVSILILQPTPVSPILSGNCSTCDGCQSHFRDLREGLRTVERHKRFMKDTGDGEEIIRKIMACENMDLHNLHKFEKKIGRNLIFRVLIDKIHVLYAVTESQKIVFLRAFSNHKE
jgi:hypothetical protein